MFWMVAPLGPEVKYMGIDEAWIVKLAEMYPHYIYFKAELCVD